MRANGRIETQNEYMEVSELQKVWKRYTIYIYQLYNKQDT